MSDFIKARCGGWINTDQIVSAEQCAENNPGWHITMVSGADFYITLGEWRRYLEAQGIAV